MDNDLSGKTSISSWHVNTDVQLIQPAFGLLCTSWMVEDFPDITKGFVGFLVCITISLVGGICSFCIVDTTLGDKVLLLTYGRLVVFSRYSGFLQQ